MVLWGPLYDMRDHPAVLADLQDCALSCFDHVVLGIEFRWVHAGHHPNHGPYGPYSFPLNGFFSVVDHSPEQCI